MQCGAAVQQLQGYAQQVNQTYQNEYWQGIPARCPAYDAFGRPYNPVIVQNCRNQMFASLNYWYSQQCNSVNNWYIQISNTCSNSNARPKPAPRVNPSGTGQHDEIQTDNIDDLDEKVAQNDTETKDVMISIPSTPSGFRAPR